MAFLAIRNEANIDREWGSKKVKSDEDYELEGLGRVDHTWTNRASQGFWLLQWDIRGSWRVLPRKGT